MSTKFTENSAVFLHLACSIQPDLPVIWVDTGYNTRATVAFSRHVVDRLGLSLQVYRPDGHTIIMPPELDDPTHGVFTREVKLEPFKRALQDLQADAWLSSVERYQSVHRKILATFDAQSDGILKVSPLLDWTDDDVVRYRQDHDLPLGPLCFDPTKGESFRQCGLHHDLGSAARAI